jgi:predicted component of type VI protein secretion system
MFNYGIGGQEVPRDASEGIADIPMNKTLLIEKLTADDPLEPEIKKELNTIEDVFNHYKPNVKVEFQKEDGTFQTEELRFSGMGDFGVKGISNQSNFLKDLEMKKNEYAKIIKQLKSNKVLKTVLDNPDSKAAFIQALQAMAQEIDDAK